MTDPYVNYKAKFDQVAEFGTCAYDQAQNGKMKEFIQEKAVVVIDKVTENGEYLKESVTVKASVAKELALEKIQDSKVYAEVKVLEVKEKLVVFYDDARNYVGLLIKVLPEK